MKMIMNNDIAKQPKKYGEIVTTKGVQVIMLGRMSQNLHRGVTPWRREKFLQNFCCKPNWLVFSSDPVCLQSICWPVATSLYPGWWKTHPQFQDTSGMEFIFFMRLSSMASTTAWIHCCSSSSVYFFIFPLWSQLYSRNFTITQI